MRIGIDYHPATTHWPGAGRYARELVRALVQLDDASIGARRATRSTASARDGAESPSFALFDVGRAARVVDERALGLSLLDPRVRLVRRNLSRRFLALAGPLGISVETFLGDVDLFHHTLVDGPRVARARQSMAICELPSAGTPAHEALARRLKAMDGVFVFSHDFALRVTRSLGIPRERVFQVPVGAEHWRRSLARLEELDDPPVLLVLGATRRSRRPSAVLRAFERLVAGGLDARLVFAGGVGDGEAELTSARASSPVGAQVTRRLDVREHDLPALVARASVLVHLSDDEGTPVTPLEAFAVGCAVVASRIPAFEEALGAEAILVENDALQREPASLTEACARAIASARDGLARDRRMACAAAFTWDAAARATVAAWSTIVAAPARC